MKLCTKRQQNGWHAVEAPNYKHQITNKSQWSKFQSRKKRFGHSKLKLTICDLEFHLLLGSGSCRVRGKRVGCFLAQFCATIKTCLQHPGIEAVEGGSETP